MNKNPPRRARALTAGLVALLLAALAAALVLWRQWASELNVVTLGSESGVL